MTTTSYSPAPSAWSAGLPADADYCLLEPDDVPMFSENFWFVGYDHASGVGHYLHLGADPRDFSTWTEQLVIVVGTEQFYFHWDQGTERAPDRVAGPRMVLQNIEPFRTWKLTYDGPAAPSTLTELKAGPISKTIDQTATVSLDLDVETVAPTFLAAAGGQHATPHEGQAFSSHYEQMYRVNGTITVAGHTHVIGGFGLRDHSRGPRDLTGWGTHALFGGAFPSGRAFGLFTVVGRDGTVRLEDGYVYDAGTYRRAIKTEHTPLTDINATPGETVHVRLHLDDGDIVEITGETITAALLTFEGAADGGPGVDRANPEGTVLMEAFPRWNWDGELGGGILERTATIKTLRR
ncbi:hypothetical protein [uncultured Jatrophihabitans sp.]|uniref:DUF7065 domain-containing protein n=1 Tax=uncultured Jatrophihabitans sp. TaxID=1610747 RepID=UPI0035CB78DC